MKFKYLGTAAAEGWPAVFCNCDHCLRAKKAGGKNLRTRSQSLINEDLLIDFPIDTYAHALKNQLDLSAVKYCLFTHQHMDHCTPVDLFCRADGVYAHKLTEPEIKIICNQAVKDRIYKTLNAHDDEAFNFGVSFDIIPLYTPQKYGKYTVTSMKANHAENAVIYIINDGEKTILYLHDTGELFDEVYDYLTANKIKADFVSYDCTFVALKGSGGHMGLDTNIITRDKLKQLGIIDENTINCINHFSHNGKLIYDELVPVAEKEGFLTSYDGMELEI
ncbi:hypothetical protein LJB90_00410 [Eubacteriales bacterium OttesenSCG-928-G02]|nr:hypothetical protein [Eubacteriales bacterium OttesenSCG-928-G02]